jgi:hypothetical protein
MSIVVLPLGDTNGAMVLTTAMPFLVLETESYSSSQSLRARTPPLQTEPQGASLH